MSLSRLFTNNYQYLETVAKRITRCKDYRRAPELMSCTYLRVSNKEYPVENDEFVKWFCKCMKNDFVWGNSEFNKIYDSQDLSYDVDRNDNKKKFLDSGFENTYKELIIDEDALKNVELAAEETNDFTKEIIAMSANLGKEKALKYLETIEFKRTLSEPDKILFELYFEKELSTRKIALLYSDEVHEMNYQSVNQMINRIKTKINLYKWKE